VPLARALEYHSMVDCRLAGYPITDFLVSCGGVAGASVLCETGFSLVECIKAGIITDLRAAWTAGYRLRECLHSGLLSRQGGQVNETPESDVEFEDDAHGSNGDIEDQKHETEPKKKKQTVLGRAAGAALSLLRPSRKNKEKEASNQVVKTTPQLAQHLPKRARKQATGEWVSAAVLARLAGFEMSEIKAEGLVTSALQARDFGFSATEAKDASFTLAECLRAGYSELRHAKTALCCGFSPVECREAGLIKTPQEARDAGFDLSQAMSAGFTLRELWQAGFIRCTSDLLAAGASEVEMQLFLQQLAKEVSDELAKDRALGNPTGLREIADRLDFLQGVDINVYKSCLEVIKAAIDSELKNAQLDSLLFKEGKFEEAVKLHKTLRNARDLLQGHVKILDTTSRLIHEGFAKLVDKTKDEICDDDVDRCQAVKTLGLQALASVYTVKDSLVGEFEDFVNQKLAYLSDWTTNTVWPGLMDDLEARSIVSSSAESSSKVLAFDIVENRRRRGHYAVLGVDRGADKRMLFRARNDLAQKLHPDKAANGASDKIMVEAMTYVNSAYDTLSDAEMRQEYDRHLNETTDTSSIPPRSRPMRFKRVAFKLIKQYQVAFYLNIGKAFCKYFSSQFSVGAVSFDYLRIIGIHVQAFTAVEGEIGRAAKSVRENIAGFAMYKAADYNKKAGGVTVEHAIGVFRIKKLGTVYQARLSTIDQAFRGYGDEHNTLFNEFIRQAGAAASHHGVGTHWLEMSLRDKAKALASKLDPRRLYKDPRTVGALMAVVAVQWTKSMLRKSRGVRPEDIRHDSLWMPHNTQLLGTFAMLGLAANEDIKNHLIRCGTGEGKSVCLGLTAAMFALLGMEVYVASYNERLSRRDHTLFSPLFIDLGVDARISYSTIKAVIGKMLVNGTLPDLRGLTSAYLRSKSISGDQQNLVFESAVLLVDEVDVLLGDGYYGSTFNPVVNLEAEDLFIYMWDNRRRFQEPNIDNHQIIRELRRSDACRRFLTTYPRMTGALLEVMLRRMLEDIKLFVGTQPPIGYKYVKDTRFKRIGHLEANEGGTSWVMDYGPKTQFARILEFGRDCGGLAYGLPCGKLLYSEIPLKFPIILGLTATLPSESYAPLLTGYDFVYQSHLPSTFDKKKPMIHRPSLVTSKSEFFERIARDSQAREAVVIILEDKAMITDCREFLLNSGTLAGVAVLHEEDDDLRDEDIASAIELASSSGTVTLASAAFARGTDFPACDHRVSRDGGVLVLDTVPWPSRADEEQAMGRSGRQDDPGQYKQLWLFDRVEAIWGKQTAHNLLEVSQDPSGAATAKWAVIVDQVRQQQETAKCTQMRKNNDAFRPDHDLSLQLPQYLARNDISLLLPNAS